MTNRRFRASDSAWLFLALLLQSTLLLLPYSKPQKQSPAQEVISVTLDIQSDANPPQAGPPKTTPVPQQPIEAQQPKQEQQPALVQAASASQEFDPKAAPSKAPDVQLVNPKRILSDSSSTRVSAAQLLIDASELEFPQPESKKTKQLGDAEPIALPVNWLPNMKLDDNLFADRMLTGRLEIVDQWSGADGGYNAIVKTSSGHTLCGHSQPRNRISSMEASVVMWRLCD